METTLTLSPPAGLDQEALAAHPEVRRWLKERGVVSRPLPGESQDDFENRLGTHLMALWRDLRDTRAFEALYGFSRRAVLQWIRGLLGRDLGFLDPTEVLQDTFVNVYRYPGAFRDDHRGSFRVWVRTIAGNAVRRASAHRARLSYQELPEGLQEPEDLSQNPVRTFEEGDESCRLRTSWMLFLGHYERAWRTLSERDRRTLQLVEVEGLSYQEAGKILGVGRSNMKMIVFRSRKRIARHMRLAMNASVMRPFSELGVA